MSDKPPKVLLIIVIVVCIPLIIYLLIFEYKNKQGVGIEEQIKKLIPDKYTIIEKGEESEEGCTLLYRIHPKDFTEIQLKNLIAADISYCKDRNTVAFINQTGPIIYNKEKDEWIFSDGTKADEKVMVGEKEVTLVRSLNSHLSVKVYIDRVGKGDEIVVFYIPETNRIRCDFIKDKEEKEECINLLTSMNMSPESTDFVPEEIYENDYKELVEIIKDI